jgi:serine/threonine protein kinase
MFNLDLGGNGDTHAVTPDLIKQSIDSLEDEKQRDFILSCLQKEPNKRPSAKELLFHPLLFEVPSLRLIATHTLIKKNNDQSCKTNNEIIFNDSEFTREPDYVIATTNRFYNDIENRNITDNGSVDFKPSNSTSNNNVHLLTSNQKSMIESKHFNFKYSSLAQFDPNKYYEDVKNGIYPLTAYGLEKSNIHLTNSNFIEKKDLNNIEDHKNSSFTRVSASPSNKSGNY